MRAWRLTCRLEAMSQERSENINSVKIKVRRRLGSGRKGIGSSPHCSGRLAFEIVDYMMR
jgi:hypothetical protein